MVDSAVTRVEEGIFTVEGGKAWWDSGQKWALAHGSCNFEGGGWEWKGEG